MNIRIARPDEFPAVRAFYHALIDGMRGRPDFPGWEKEIHPSDAVLREGLAAGTLYLGEEDGQIVAGMVLNHEVGQGYDEARWQVSAPPEQVTVLHILAVGCAHQGRGLAARMLAHAIEASRRAGQKSLRLDVMAGNTAAERLYERYGFVCVHERRSVYFAAGEITARLMERVL